MYPEIHLSYKAGVSDSNAYTGVQYALEQYVLNFEPSLRLWKFGDMFRPRRSTSETDISFGPRRNRPPPGEEGFANRGPGAQSHTGGSSRRTGHDLRVATHISSGPGTNRPPPGEQGLMSRGPGAQSHTGGTSRQTGQDLQVVRQYLSQYTVPRPTLECEDEGTVLDADHTHTIPLYIVTFLPLPPI